jgi:hypothetical protein
MKLSSGIQIDVDPNSFKLFMLCAIPIAKEVRLKITSSSFSIRCLDSGHVGMTEIILNNDNVNVKDEIIIGLNLEKVASIMNNFIKDETMSIIVSDSESVLSIQSEEIKYFIRLVDKKVLNKEPPELKLTFPTSVVVDSGKLASAITACSAISDKISFTGYEKGIIVNTSEMNSDDKLEFMISDVNNQCDISQNSSTFPADYLLDIFKYLKNMSNIRVDFGTNYPIRFKSESEEKNINVTYLVSPRIEHE